ncbi:unnamed protein product [Oikopleura dioica]|uniref:Fibrillar collagen NC1 domain-containing protein n=1 Tax=Oikopleura dioica TaxID=34765 RepID=E4XEQ6_OIKDI|nr:unnamed protein product [Oikopleura dioica]
MNNFQESQGDPGRAEAPDGEDGIMIPGDPGDPDKCSFSEENMKKCVTDQAAFKGSFHAYALMSKGDAREADAAGEQGDAGITGCRGKPGSQKQIRIYGPRGPGLAGEPEKKGELGVSVKIGEPRIDRLAGYPGIPGICGSDGITGLQGAPGDTESICGRQGNNGGPGEDGIPGNPGQPGNLGKQGRLLCIGSPCLERITGPQGQKGRVGEPGYTGSSEQPGDQGIHGKIGRSAAPVDCTEAFGEAGDDGVDGHSGIKGMIGIAGQPGSPRQRGLCRLEGPLGETGRKSLPGLKGKIGFQANQRQYQKLKPNAANSVTRVKQVTMELLEETHYLVKTQNRVPGAKKGPQDMAVSAEEKKKTDLLVIMENKTCTNETKEPVGFKGQVGDLGAGVQTRNAKSIYCEKKHCEIDSLKFRSLLGEKRTDGADGISAANTSKPDVFPGNHVEPFDVKSFKGVVAETLRGPRCELGELGEDGPLCYPGPQGGAGMNNFQESQGDPGRAEAPDGEDGIMIPGDPGDPDKCSFSEENMKKCVTDQAAFKGSFHAYALMSKGDAREADAAGEQGDAGITGCRGKPGSQKQIRIYGPRGPGLAGEPEKKGELGVSVKIGEPRIDRLAGYPGIPGICGSDGITGLQGAPGDTGLCVANGEPGLPGESICGRQGNNGGPGEDGIPGNPGQPGNLGKQGRLLCIGSPCLERITGPQGQKGRVGEPGYTGSSEQPGDQGIHGKIGRSAAPVDCTEAFGEAGDDGVDGHSGIKGMIGIAGQPGSPRQRGLCRLEGPLGETGRKSLPELKGKIGFQANQRQYQKLKPNAANSVTRVKQVTMELLEETHYLVKTQNRVPGAKKGPQDMAVSAEEKRKTDLLVIMENKTCTNETKEPVGFKGQVGDLGAGVQTRNAKSIYCEKKHCEIDSLKFRSLLGEKRTDGADGISAANTSKPDVFPGNRVEHFDVKSFKGVVAETLRGPRCELGEDGPLCYPGPQGGAGMNNFQESQGDPGRAEAPDGEDGIMIPGDPGDPDKCSFSEENMKKCVTDQAAFKESFDAYALMSKGDAGEADAAGEQGDAGITGCRGKPGSQKQIRIYGPRGPGLAGQPGMKEELGVSVKIDEPRNYGGTGYPGVPGICGERDHPGTSVTGEKGKRGSDGLTGLQGAPGHLGLCGANGEPGLPGESICRQPGDNGRPGEDRISGHPGQPGCPEKPGLFLRIGSPFPERLTGPQGQKDRVGEPGCTGYPGKSGDQGILGENGKSAAPCVFTEAFGEPNDDGVDCHSGIKGMIGIAGRPGSPRQRGLCRLEGPLGFPGETGRKGLPEFKSNEADSVTGDIQVTMELLEEPGYLVKTENWVPKAKKGPQDMAVSAEEKGKPDLLVILENKACTNETKGPVEFKEQVGDLEAGVKIRKASSLYSAIDFMPRSSPLLGKIRTDAADGISGEPGVILNLSSKPIDGHQDLRDDAGPPGLPGRSGVLGSSCFPGQRGKLGEVGQTGVKGRKSQPGLQGHQGEREEMGPIGDLGKWGLPGETDRPGIEEDEGAVGEKGDSAPPADKGIIGIPELNDKPGGNGTPGKAVEHRKRGEQGFAGEPGALVAKGFPGETGATGNYGENCLLVIVGEIGGQIELQQIDIIEIPFWIQMHLFGMEFDDK